MNKSNTVSNLTNLCTLPMNGPHTWTDAKFLSLSSYGSTIFLLLISTLPCITIVYMYCILLFSFTISPLLLFFFIALIGSSDGKSRGKSRWELVRSWEKNKLWIFITCPPSCNWLIGRKKRSLCYAYSYSSTLFPTPILQEPLIFSPCFQALWLLFISWSKI